MTESFKAGGDDWLNRHLDAYLKTGGKMGHLVDFSPYGPKETPCLILQTTGRKSGKSLMVPLVYTKDDDHFVVIASRAGAPSHPAWFLNLEANPEVKFQVADAKYRGKARIAEGAERQRLWDKAVAGFPAYAEYAKKTTRIIPVVVLQPEATIDRL